MSIKRILLAALVAAAGTSVGQARAADVIFATGVTFGGFAQKYVSCVYTNVSNTSIKIKRFVIVNQLGQTLDPDVRAGCGEGAIGPFGTCGIQATLADGNANAHSCQALVGVTNRPKLRGTLEIKDINQNVLNSQPLQ